MYSFKNDYSEGCHPAILEALRTLWQEQVAWYGEDSYSEEARDILRKKMLTPEAWVYFVSGGTQANLTVIASLLRPHEAVIAASSWHIAVHEAGAIEATWHKVVIHETNDGKLTGEHIESLLHEHALAPHMVKPRLVYISNTTEVGTLYTKHEIEDIARTCKNHDLLFFIDGARLGSALTAEGTDITLADIAHSADVFTIWGTKNGALFGEAIVIPENTLQRDFLYHVKQRGALLAKGWILGIQFRELFRDDLYFDLARHANVIAGKMSEGCMHIGYTLLTPSNTNQIFPILPNTVIASLMEEYEFYIWQKIDMHHSAIRLVTSWATPDAQAEAFIETLKRLTSEKE